MLYVKVSGCFTQKCCSYSSDSGVREILRRICRSVFQPLAEIWNSQSEPKWCDSASSNLRSSFTACAAASYITITCSNPESVSYFQRVTSRRSLSPLGDQPIRRMPLPSLELGVFIETG